MSEASEFFQFPTYETDGGNVMDDLFESELMLSADTFDHRYRTISTSSVSSTLASYSASEIFPDIAGVMTADASDEYEICEELVLENDYSSADTTFMSPVRRRRRRHSSVRISISQMDANVVEMLDTLGFMARDLTRATDLVPGDIDLFWQNGSLHAADLAYERTECQRENTVPSVEVFAMKSDKVPEVKLDVEEPVLVCAEDIAVSSDITSLLEQFEEEMKPFESSEVTFTGLEANASHSVIAGITDSSCVDESVPKTDASLEKMYVNTDSDCTAVPCEKLNIKSCEGVSDSMENITECEVLCKKSAMCPLPVIVEPVQQDISSAYVDDASATSRKKLKRTKSIDIKCQKVKEIAETVITEQKKMEMMEKARAISQKISRKEFTHKLQSMPKSNNEIKCEIGKAFRIPRLKTDHSKKPELSIGFTSASEPIIVVEKRSKDVQVRTIKHEDVKSKKLLIPHTINSSSSSSIADSSIRSDFQQLRSSSAELSSHFVALIPTENSETELSKQSSEDSECSTSSVSGTVSSTADPVDFAHHNDNVLTESVSFDTKSKLQRLMPSREMIEKIASSNKQKTTILLPNAVPAFGERGTAIGIVNTQSSLKKAHIASSSVEMLNIGLQLGQQTETQPSESGDKTAFKSAESGSDEKSDVQTSLMSGDTKPLKRKLNLSEYKSILRERRKSLASSSGCQTALLQNIDCRSLAAPDSKSQLSVVHVYGSCRQVGLDHDYCRRSDVDVGGVDVQDSSSSQSSECGSIGGSSDSASQSTVLTRPLVAMAADDSSSEVMECKFMSQLMPSGPVIGTPALSVLSSSEESRSIAANEKFTSVSAVDSSLEHMSSRHMPELTAATSLLKTATEKSFKSAKEFRFVGCKPGSLSSVLRQDLIPVTASKSRATATSSATVSAAFNLDALNSQSVKDFSRNDDDLKLSGIEELGTTSELAKPVDVLCSHDEKRETHSTASNELPSFGCIQQYKTFSKVNVDHVELQEPAFKVDARSMLTEKFAYKLDASSPTPVLLDMTSDDSICSSSTRSTSSGVPVRKKHSVGKDELKPEIVYIDHREKPDDRPGMLPMDCSETDAEQCASGSGQTSGWQLSSSRSRSKIPRRYRRRKSYSSSSSSSSQSRSSCDRHWRSRSRSRSPSTSRYCRRKYKLQSRSRSRSYYCSRSRSRSRSTSQCRVVTIDRRKKTDAEQQREMEERRIVYVGRIPKHYTKSDLKHHLQSFGEIVNISVHFRSQGDDYGFVTFRSAADAFSAIEKGRSIPGCENFDFCFGGRRQFCRSDYADLDGKLEFEEEYSFASAPAGPISHASCSFDELLNQATRQIRRRKS